MLNVSVGDTVRIKGGAWSHQGPRKVVELHPGEPDVAGRIIVEKATDKGDWLGPRWGHFDLEVVKPAAPAVQPLRRRDLNPGDLFYHTSPNSRSKVPMTQLRYVPGGPQHDPDPALGAVRSPQEPGFWLGPQGLNRTVRKVEGEELKRLQEEAKKHKVTDAQRKQAGALCAIMGHYSGRDLGFAAEVMGISPSDKEWALAQASFQAQPNQAFVPAFGEGERARWGSAATALFANKMPKGWVNAGDRVL